LIPVLQRQAAMTDEPISNREANYGRMLRHLTPAGLFLTALATGCFIEWEYPGGDSRNIASPCCMIVTAPAALILAISAIKETLRPKGLRILLAAGATWLLVAMLVCLLLWSIVRFGILKHAF
jgi:hypothetical protein